MHKKYHKKFKILDILAVTTQARLASSATTAASCSFERLHVTTQARLASSACPRQKTIQPRHSPTRVL